MKFFYGNDLKWMNQPKSFSVSETEIVIYTDPRTDFWQRTYYGFQNDNAPALFIPIDEDFTFSFWTEFNSRTQYDQCGVVIYQNSDNWFKASSEYENSEFQRLGSVVTNNGYSDWATSDISADIKRIGYRLSRRGKDFLIEVSAEEADFRQMRIFHLFDQSQAVNVGVYACSPLKSSFCAKFTEFKLQDCLWASHK